MGDDPIAIDNEFQSTKPVPKYKTYSLKLVTLKTVPYTTARIAMESKLDKPSQKLPKNVRENLALVLAVAVNHHTLLDAQA